MDCSESKEARTETELQKPGFWGSLEGGQKESSSQKLFCPISHGKSFEKEDLFSRKLNAAYRSNKTNTENVPLASVTEIVSALMRAHPMEWPGQK